MNRSSQEKPPALSHRIALLADIPAIIQLMQVAIAENMKPYLSPAEIEAAKETMGVDRSLIDDQTYFVIETSADGKAVMVGCGGWGKPGYQDAERSLVLNRVIFAGPCFRRALNRKYHFMSWLGSNKP